MIVADRDSDVGINLRNSLDYLGAYSLGMLSHAEERMLHERALDDQDLFNAMANEYPLRAAFANTEFRRQMMCHLRQLRDRQAHGFPAFLFLRDWFSLPSRRLAVASVAVVLFVGIGLRWQMNRVANEPTASHPIDLVPVFKGLPPASGGSSAILESDLQVLWEGTGSGSEFGATLELGRRGDVPKYSIGDPIRIRFSVVPGGEALLLAKAPNGTVSQLYPSAMASVSADGDRSVVFIPGEGLGYARVSGPLGRTGLKLLVFPPGTSVSGLDVLGTPPLLTIRREFEVKEEVTNPPAGDDQGARQLKFDTRDAWGAPVWTVIPNLVVPYWVITVANLVTVDTIRRCHPPRTEPYGSDRRHRRPC